MKKTEIDHSNETFLAIVSTKSDIKLHDVTFKVGDRNFSANKVIVACRSSYWRQKFKESNADTFEIADTNAAAFNEVLSYIYCGKLVILKGMTAELVIEIIRLAEKYKLNRLTEQMINALHVHQNGFWILYKMANDLNSKTLLQRCMDFADSQPNSVLDDNRFLKLTAQQIITILQRSTFYCPEIELFHACRKWLANNDNQHTKELMECIRFENMSPEDIESICGTTNFDCKQYIEQVSARNLNRPRISCRINEYSPPLHYITFRKNGLHEMKILVQNQDSIQAPHKVCPKYICENYDECILCFKLPIISRINHMMVTLTNEFKSDDKLITANSGEFCYFIEVSTDGEKWTRVCDRTSDCCCGPQYVCFASQVAQYIRIHGVDWSNKGRHYFWSWIELIFQNRALSKCFHCSFEPQTLKANNCLLTAFTNVALYRRGTQLFVCDAKVIGCSLLEDFKLDDKYENPCALKFMSSASDNFIDVVFSQQFKIDTIKLLLYDKDATNYDFKLYVAKDHKDIYFDIDNDSVNRRPGKSNNWSLVAEKNNVSSWQTITFPAQTVAVVSIQCTAVRTKLSHKDFRVVHIECCSSQNNTLFD